jgi:hypothetical protein
MVNFLSFSLKGVSMKLSVRMSIIFSLCFSSMYVSAALRPHLGDLNPSSGFTDIIKRAQWHFHNPAWLVSDPGLYECHGTICRLLNQRELKVQEFVELIENSVDFYLLAHMRWEIKHDLIARRVRDDMYNFFKGFIKLNIIFIDETRFMHAPDELKDENIVRLVRASRNRRGLKNCFLEIFKLQLTDEIVDQKDNKEYVVAYVQDDLVEILDTLDKIDRLGAREVTHFSTVAAQLVVLKTKLEIIAAIQRHPLAQQLALETAEFFVKFFQEIVNLCSCRKYNIAKP